MFYFLAAFVLLFGSFVLQGLRKIPANPPHKGVKTWLGKKVILRDGTCEVCDEGWGFYPFFPYLYGFIPIKVARITFEVVSAKTRTPDGAESKVPVWLTVRPIPELLHNYIASGKEAGVVKQLTGKIQERIREWAMGQEEGRQPG